MFRTLQRGAAGVHLVLLAAIVAGVFLQVYLIGAYVFGAGDGALEAHRTAGFTVHGLEVLVFVAALVAWLPTADVILSAVLASLGTVQITLASETKWVGALHPLGALLVLVLAAMLLRRRQAAWRTGRVLRA